MSRETCFRGNFEFLPMTNKFYLLLHSLTWLSLLYYCMSTADQNKELLGAIVLSVEPSALEVICGLFSLPPPWPVLLIKTLKYVLTKLGSYSFEMGCNIIQLILRNGRGQELKCE